MAADITNGAAVDLCVKFGTVEKVNSVLVSWHWEQLEVAELAMRKLNRGRRGGKITR